ncbi:MAG: amidoligase family protein [Pseudomonadota bacterium]
MSRKFGVELEIVGITREQAKRCLRLVGIAVQNEGYNHTTRSHWKIVPDASVQGGFEVVSPILEGVEGLEQLRAVVTALDDMGGSVNRSCGYHVHFDASDLGVDHIRSIVTRYAAYEAEIDNFMPQSRRANQNRFCQSIVSLAQNERFKSAQTLQSLIGAQAGRYFKVNLQAYHTHGTIEFRQHSGTLNAPKAVNWVRLLDAFITESKARVDAPASSMAPCSTSAPLALRGVSAQLASMFGQGAVTLEAMCNRFGWQAHSARAAVTRLRKAGMDIVFHRATGYELRGHVHTDGDANVQDNLFAGVAEGIATFYRNRAAILSAA